MAALLAGCAEMREAGGHFENLARETPPAGPDADSVTRGAWPAENLDAVPAHPPVPLSRAERRQMIREHTADAARARREDAAIRKPGR